jgi:hypothetical protein
MRNGICPKCNSATVYSQAGGVFYQSPNNLHVRTSSMSMGVQYASFICTSCGYFENYVDDRSKLADVAAKWQKVPAEGR